jgi:hypothetical protein
LARTGPASVIPYPCHQTNKQTTRTKDFTLNVKLQEQVNYLCTTQEETFGEVEPKDSSYTGKILKIERMIFQHH